MSSEATRVSAGSELAFRGSRVQGATMGEGGGTLLSVRSVTKTFDGISAVQDVSVEVGHGELVGLVGPNGAGKTTLFDCISGRLRPDRGHVFYEGSRIDHWPVHRRARAGIARTFQRMELFEELTVREHLLVADRAHRGGVLGALVHRGQQRPAERQRVDAMVELFGLTEVADTLVSALPLGTCRLVELARAMTCEPKLLLADEPSSGLGERDRDHITAVLRDAQSHWGMAMLLVEHDLAMVSQVVDRIVVMHLGRVIASGDYQTVMADPEVRRAYLGHAA